MDNLVSAVQQFGFPIVISVGLGYFVYYVWRTIINVINPAIKNMHSHKRTSNEHKLVLLGVMLELGQKSNKLHKTLSNAINRSDIDKVFVYGKYIRETFNSLSTNKKGKVFENLKEAYNYFGKIIRNNDLLMVKGSNATGLNRFSKKIKRGQISAI